MLLAIFEIAHLLQGIVNSVENQMKQIKAQVDCKVTNVFVFIYLF